MAPTIKFFALILLPCVTFSCLSLAQTIFNVQTFGAIPGGTSDCTKAFLSAWAAACASAAPATFYVPPGTYLVGAITFNGNPCVNMAITMEIDGTLVAPINYMVLGSSGNWIKFEKVTGVTIIGGTIDGQGASLWYCKSHKSSCPKGSTSLEFSGSKNVVVSGLTSLNCQFIHLHIYDSQNVLLQGLTISAPANSPNTAGVYISYSSNVKVTNAGIGTGDDCISVGPGSTNLLIQGIACSPGHGISIGSLGAALQEPGVQNVTISTVTFSGTENGARIKTYGNPSDSFVQGVVFQNAIMVDVQNPIIIDQNYCNGKHCGAGQQSGVQIRNVMYKNITGTSASQVAVNFICSETNPCSGITLEDVDLSFIKPAAVMASCVNAFGSASGVINPKNCLE